VGCKFWAGDVDDDDDDDDDDAFEEEEVAAADPEEAAADAADVAGPEAGGEVVLERDFKREGGGRER